MTDVLTKKQRSYNMSRIRCRWTLQERIIHNILKGRKIKHQMHPELIGKPDVLIKKTKTALFLDGCFWHKCPKCYVEPETNKEFWMKKIKSNTAKDKEVTKDLKKMGFRVIRIWEHELKIGKQERLEKLIKNI